MRPARTRCRVRSLGSGALLALALLVPAARLHAQGLGTIRGIVVDANGKPVAGATVRSTGGAATATTDAGGLFTLKVKPGVHEVTATRKGYATDTAKGVDVKAGATKDLSLLLLPGA